MDSKNISTEKILWEKFIQSGFRMPLYMSLYVEGKTYVKEVTGWSHSSTLIVVENQINTVYESTKAIQEYREFVKLKIHDKNFRDNLIDSIIKIDEELLEFCKTIPRTDYGQKDGFKIIKRDFKTFCELFKKKFGVYGLPKLTGDAVESSLSKLLSVEVSNEDIAKLTKPAIQSEYTLERISFLEIIKDIVSNNLQELFNKNDSEVIDALGRHPPNIYYKIETHVRNFNWVGVSHHVQPMNINTLLVSLRVGISEKDVTKELDEKKNESIKHLQEFDELSKKYNLNLDDKTLFGFVSKLNEVNESRKAAMCKGVLWSYSLFQAMADYFKIDVVSVRQFTYNELRDILENGELSDADRKIMNERLKYFVCLLKDNITINQSGEEARKLAESELGIVDYSKISSLKGQVAQKGVATGKVRLIISEHQIGELLDGEVLVSSMTDPDMVSAMKRAVAIITDEGGITCHAAIVARELKIPCIISTKIATKVLKNGDMVEVDANTGVVKIVK